jgi:hypothetical protein
MNRLKNVKGDARSRPCKKTTEFKKRSRRLEAALCDGIGVGGKTTGGGRQQAADGRDGHGASSVGYFSDLEEGVHSACACVEGGGEEEGERGEG